MDRHDAPERYEQLIAFFGSNLPSPVERQEDLDGSIRFTGGDPPEVVVVLPHSSVVVSQFSGVWESPFTFAATFSKSMWRPCSTRTWATTLPGFFGR